MVSFDAAAEWLETDGRGGFAMGAVDGVRRRRYHAVLLAAPRTPGDRLVLVNGFEIWLDTADASYALSSQRYTPDVVYPDGATRIVDFTATPWPTWTYGLPGGISVVFEMLSPPGRGETIVGWHIKNGEGRLRVRPLVSGRDYHALHHENGVFDFRTTARGQTTILKPYPGVPAIAFSTSGSFKSGPLWFRNFFYAMEAERGLDCVEDLASPGEFAFSIAADRPAFMVLRADDAKVDDAASYAVSAIAAERARRAAISDALAASALQYKVERGTGATIVAGYPWFTDWGRDTFISMRGLALARGDLENAGQLLATWAGFVSEGMLPNRFPDGDGAPEYNSVDASLWYIIAAHDYLTACDAHRAPSPFAAAIRAACDAILAGYAGGTRFNIKADDDALLRAGAQGVALTWMDARVDGVPVTPRIGKPVEIQALWINALRIASLWSDHWKQTEARATASFHDRFIKADGSLHDVIDIDHAAGTADASVRPNQILAAGGLPFPLLSETQARPVVDCVERHLLTPLGLRTLAPEAAAYIGVYRGGPAARDHAYHQGAAWPWLLGPFVDAWLYARGRSDAARDEARSRFLPALTRHLNDAGLGHVSELVDGDAPHRPGGCPFQAWSLGEFIRIRAMLDRPSSDHHAQLIDSSTATLS